MVFPTEIHLKCQSDELHCDHAILCLLRLPGKGALEKKPDFLISSFKTTSKSRPLI